MFLWKQQKQNTARTFKDINPMLEYTDISDVQNGSKPATNLVTSLQYESQKY